MTDFDSLQASQKSGSLDLEVILYSFLLAHRELEAFLRLRKVLSMCADLEP